MISQPIYFDDLRAVWAEQLVEWAERQADEYTIDAQVMVRQGRPQLAAESMASAARYRGYADRARVLLVDMSDVTADEPPAHNHTPACPILDCPLAPATADAPPSTLAAFTGWLVEKLGRWLPWVSSETWQTCAALIQMDRERARGRLR